MSYLSLTHIILEFDCGLIESSLSIIIFDSSCLGV